MWRVTFLAIWALVLLAGSLVSGATQAEIDIIANTLDIRIVQQTSMDASNTIFTKITLTNRHTKPVMTSKERVVFFSEFNFQNFPVTQGKLRLAKYDLAYSCLFSLQTHGNNVIAPGESVSIIIALKQLLLTKYLWFPRMVVTSLDGNVKERVIKSTDDDELGFVMLAPSNETAQRNAFSSKITAIQRALRNRVEDGGRVDRSLVIPMPINVELYSRPSSSAPLKPDEILLHMGSQSDKTWYVWKDKQMRDSTTKFVFDMLRSKVKGTTFKTTSKMQSGRAMIFLSISATANDKEPALKTDEAYRIVIRKKRDGKKQKRDIIHITAKTDKGIMNSAHTLVGLLGKFSVIPDSTIKDDAYLPNRGFSMDLSINFFGLIQLKKIIDLIAHFKMNELVLPLAGREGWRIETKNMDFKELTTFASRRCLSRDECLPMSYGSDPEPNGVGSGYLSLDELKALIQYADTKYVKVVPKIPVLGDLRSAFLASRLRYNRLKGTNKEEADRFHLAEESLPPAAPGATTGDSCYPDGVLNPCINRTRTFITALLEELSSAFQGTGVKKHFHAGGDSKSIERWMSFPSCQGQSKADTMRDIVLWLQTNHPDWRIRVDEAAVTDPATNLCFANTHAFPTNGLLVDVTKVEPGNPADWGLEPAALQWLLRPPTPGVDFETDATIPYRGNKTVAAPFSRANDCANKGYHVIMSPTSFSGLDNLYEQDFDEIGWHEKETFTTLNLERMLTFEVRNYMSSMDFGPRGEPLNNFRMCQAAICVALRPENAKNIIGLHASLRGYTSRTVDQLERMIAPRIAATAQSAWASHMGQGIVKPETPSTARAMFDRHVLQRQFIQRFLNNLGYKELTIMSLIGFNYRIPPPGAYVVNAMFEPALPPFPVVPISDIPGQKYLIRSPGKFDWRPFFRESRNSTHESGYRMHFPLKANEVIELRTTSVAGDGRLSPVSSFKIGMDKLLPNDLPPQLRGGSRFRVGGPGEAMPTVDLSTMTTADIDHMLTELKKYVTLYQENELDRKRKIEAFIKSLGMTKTFEQIEREMSFGSGTANHRRVLEYSFYLMNEVWQRQLDSRLLQIHKSQLESGAFTTTPSPGGPINLAEMIVALQQPPTVPDPSRTPVQGFTRGARGQFPAGAVQPGVGGFAQAGGFRQPVSGAQGQVVGAG